MIRSLVSKALRETIEPFTGSHELWDRHRTRYNEPATVARGIAAIGERFGVHQDPEPDRPVFVFSAGWRSGSTLVQRLLVSSGSILVWGEPYANCDFVGRMAEGMRSFSRNYPPAEFFLPLAGHGSSSQIQQQWIAHLYPEVSELRRAQQDFMRQLFAASALKRGYSRWGFKECRYGIEHAVFLKWLFPDARFLFVYRDPLSAWRSHRLFGAYRRWPDHPVFTVRQFGRLWAALIRGYLEGHEAVDGMMLRYEDLVSEKISVEKLSRFVDAECDPKVLGKYVSGRGQKNLQPVPYLEKRLLQREVGTLARKLGYFSS